MTLHNLTLVITVNDGHTIADDHDGPLPDPLAVGRDMVDAWNDANPDRRVILHAIGDYPATLADDVSEVEEYYFAHDRLGDNVDHEALHTIGVTIDGEPVTRTLRRSTLARIVDTLRALSIA